MTRRDFQRLSAVRLKEAKALFRVGLYDGSYYLAGYAVECALKGCIAKQTQRYEFPDKNRLDTCWTHDLNRLMKGAKLDSDRQHTEHRDVVFRFNMQVVGEWSEQIRYKLTSRREAEELILAVSDRNHGAIAWIKQHW